MAICSAILLLALICPQDAAPRLDVVELRSGEKLEGRIAKETPDYLEIEVAPGAFVGCSKAQVASVRRGSGEGAGPAAASPRKPGERWYLLHDGRGRPVGWLHGTRSIERNGAVRLCEEWEFDDGGRRIAITCLERGGPSLEPLSSYYHERIVENERPHVAVERIVDAEIQGGELVVRRLSNRGREERSIPLSGPVWFPLLLRESLHDGLDAAGRELQVPVFDAATESLTRRVVPEPIRRIVEIDGHEVEVAEIETRSEAGRNTEWIDDSGDVLRREIAGPSLVAIPSDRETALAAASAGITVPSSVVVENEKRFGLWLPNPTWSRVEDPRGGRILLECGVRRARASLVAMEHLDRGTSLETAADAVERWWKLVWPECSLQERSPAIVRGERALRLVGVSGRRADARHIEVTVVPWDGRFLLFTADAPQECWGELRRDFECMLSAIEFSLAGIEPVRQGPLLREADARRDGGSVLPAAARIGADARGVVALPPDRESLPPVPAPRAARTADSPKR
ncbi:MAG: hypothetical protein Fur0037_05870 [Planctomycetota bacterium]